MKKTKTSKQEKELTRDLLKIVGFFVFLIILYLLAATYFKSLSNFTYKGLHFTKEKYGDLPVYHYYYYFKSKDSKVLQYNLYLLYDPRKNNISLTGSPILLTKQAVYVSIDDSYPTCPENLAAAVDLSTFLGDNQLTVISSATNKTRALEIDKQYVTCERKPDSEVVELLGGNETRVVIDGNCHRIYVGPDCRVREAVEAFKVQSIVDARANSSTGA